MVTTAVITAINETCTVWLHENCYKIAGGDSPPSYRVFPKPKQSIHSGSNKQDESRWIIFGKMENTGGVT